MINLTNIIQHKLFRNSFIYTSSNVVVAAVPFLLLPILTRFLTPYEYGIIATFQILEAIAIGFVSLDMQGVFSVNYFKLSQPELKIYVGNLAFILLVNFFTTLAIIYLLRTPLSLLINFPENWFPIIVIVALFQSIVAITLTLWQVEQKPIPYGIFQIFQISLNVTLSLIFVVLLAWHWQGRLLGIMIPSFIFGIAGILVIYKRQYIKFSFNKEYIKDALSFCIPLIPHTLGGLIMLATGRLFINSMVNVAETGIYTVGYQVGMIISLLATSFNRAWAPFLFEKLKQNNDASKIKIVKLTYLYFVVLIFLALALSFASPWFLKFFVSKNFHSADKYVIWIALGYAANGMYFMVVNYIFYAKKTYFLAWITLSTAGINVILSYYFIKTNGSIGAAQAMTVSYIIIFILSWILSTKVYKMPWLLKRSS